MPWLALLLLALSACASPQGDPRPDLAETGFVDVADGSIHYAVSGRGPPLVLLHGGRLDHRMWNAVVPLLSDSFRVVRWDAPGHGASTAPSQPTAETADELLRLLDALDLGRVTLVGFSMGAGTAVQFAIAHPSRVSRLVLISTSAPPPGAPASASRHPPLSQAEGRALLAATGIPVLMIVGERDSERIRATGDAVRREVPSAQLLLLPSASHHVVADRPLEVGSAVRVFAGGESGRIR